MNINHFRTLCNLIQKIAETRGSNAKIKLCSEYFQNLERSSDLNLAARFIGEGAFEEVSGKRASVGSRTSAMAAAHFCEIDYDLVFKPCRIATGSSSETIEKLMTNMEAARSKRKPQPLMLQEVKTVFESLYSVSSRAEKHNILIDVWKKMTPVEIKYFIRMLGQGSLRIGFEKRSVVSSIAKAFDKDIEEIRYAHMITGSIGKTAVLAKTGRLDEAIFRLFHPLSFMLASPVESRSIENFEDYVAEEKFDGMRCQVHVSGSRVRLFSRDLNDVTTGFPDITGFFAGRNLPPAVFDGEICVYKDQKILPFQMLQKRMGVKKPGKKILDLYPVLFISYDLLYADGKPLFDMPIEKRREELIRMGREYSLPVSSQVPVKDQDQIDRLFERALAHGNEGLILKKKGSKYEYGQRKKTWLKVKKPGGSLDTVMMYAHAGSGKRGGTYSDFTLGISVKDDERYEEEYIPIGKAYGGYTDRELKKLNTRIKEITVEKYGPTLGLLHDIVVELEFDDIQINKRTKAGFTLRLPRFKAIRWDLSPADADTLKDVEKMFEEKLAQDRLRQNENPSFIYSAEKHTG